LFGSPSFGGGLLLQVCREPDCAVMNICPSWITQRLPMGQNPSRKTSAGGGKPNHWSVIGRASVESDFPSVMDPSIAIVGCIAGVALVWKCLTF
jgi:hypothetical protein